MNRTYNCPNCKTNLEIKSIIPIRTMASVLGGCAKCKKEYSWMIVMK